MTNPTFAEIVTRADSVTTTVTEWSDGGRHVRVAYDIDVWSSGTTPDGAAADSLVWTITDTGRHFGLVVGARYAITSAVVENDGPSAVVSGRKIRKNGTIEQTEHYLGHVDTK